MSCFTDGERGCSPSSRLYWRYAGGAEILQHEGSSAAASRIAATAASYGVTVSPHWFHDVHVHLVASTPNARFVEFFPDDQVLDFRRLIDRQLE